jgi:hypothetical protein
MDQARQMQHKTTLKCYPLHHTPCITTRKAAFTSIQYIMCSCMQLCQYCKFLMKTPQNRSNTPIFFSGGCASGPPLRLRVPLIVFGGWAAKNTARGQELAVCHLKVLATLVAGGKWQVAGGRWQVAALGLHGHWPAKGYAQCA